MFSGCADYGFHAEIACFNPWRQRVFAVDHAVQRMVCLFNLLPIPPLDGSRLLDEFLPPQTAYKYNSFVGRYGFYILIALVASGLISYIITPFALAYLELVNTVLGIFF